MKQMPLCAADDDFCDFDGDDDSDADIAMPMMKKRRSGLAIYISAGGQFGNVPAQG